MMAMPSRVNSSPYRRLDPCWSPWKVEIVLGLLLQELGFFKRKKSESWRFEVISCTNSELLATFDVALPWTSDQALRKTKRRPCLPCRPREKLKNVPPLRLKTPLSLKVRTCTAFSLSKTGHNTPHPSYLGGSPIGPRYAEFGRTSADFCWRHLLEFRWTLLNYWRQQNCA